MQGTNKQEASRLIESEEERLKDVERLARAGNNNWVRFVSRSGGFSPEAVSFAIANARSIEDFGKQLPAQAELNLAPDFVGLLQGGGAPLHDFNEARSLLGCPPLDEQSRGTEASPEHPSGRRGGRIGLMLLQTAKRRVPRMRRLYQKSPSSPRRATRDRRPDLSSQPQICLD